MKGSDKIVVVDYIGNCNSKGEAIGHVLKTLKEANDFLGDRYNIKYMLTSDYAKYFDNHNIIHIFKHSSKVNYNGGRMKKALFRLKKILAVMKALRKEEKIWFLNTDFYLYLGLLLSFTKGKKIFVTNYIDYEKDEGLVGIIKKKVYQLSLKKIAVEFTTNPNKKTKRCRFVPDYSFDQSKYSKYFCENKQDRVYMCGGINEAKDIEGLVSTFNKNNQPLVVKGNFSSEIQYEKLLKVKNKNISLEHKFLNDDEFYHNIASNKYVILPYKKRKLLS
nr:hypothetical protein [Priestia megaterium]MDH3182752.1 hypothetical protein [Priestia megaterium]